MERESYKLIWTTLLAPKEVEIIADGQLASTKSCKITDYYFCLSVEEGYVEI